MRRDGDLNKYKRHLLSSSHADSKEDQNISVSPERNVKTNKALIEAAKAANTRAKNSSIKSNFDSIESTGENG